MTNSQIDAFEAMLRQGRDDALLRFGLGNAYLKAGDAAQAVTHLEAALRHDPRFSAAYKLLGKALTDCDRIDEALGAYRNGIEAANERGDVQAAKEMSVFARRLASKD
ncbi:MAG: tetratricopeptide repeat protein [Gammaproteobacteria bacterium]